MVKTDQLLSAFLKFSKANGNFRPINNNIQTIVSMMEESKVVHPYVSNFIFASWVLLCRTIFKAF